MTEQNGRKGEFFALRLLELLFNLWNMNGENWWSDFHTDTYKRRSTSLSINKICNMLSDENWSTKNMKFHEQYYRLQKCVSIWLKLKVSLWTFAKIFTFYIVTQKQRSVTQFWLVLFISSLDKTATIIYTLPSFHLCTK